jgi:hypothetical protein
MSTLSKSKQKQKQKNARRVLSVQRQLNPTRQPREQGLSPNPTGKPLLGRFISLSGQSSVGSDPVGVSYYDRMSNAGGMFGGDGQVNEVWLDQELQRVTDQQVDWMVTAFENVPGYPVIISQPHTEMIRQRLLDGGGDAAVFCDVTRELRELYGVPADALPAPYGLDLDAYFDYEDKCMEEHGDRNREAMVEECRVYNTLQECGIELSLAESREVQHRLWESDSFEETADLIISEYKRKYRRV